MAASSRLVITAAVSPNIWGLMISSFFAVQGMTATWYILLRSTPIFLGKTFFITAANMPKGDLQDDKWGMNSGWTFST
jgi:hypothetical protein